MKTSALEALRGLMRAADAPDPGTEVGIKAILADLNGKMHAEYARLSRVPNAEYDVTVLREMQAESSVWEQQRTAIRSRRAVAARLRAEERAWRDGLAYAENDEDNSKARSKTPAPFREKWDEGFAAYWS